MLKHANNRAKAFTGFRAFLQSPLYLLFLICLMDHGVAKAQCPCFEGYNLGNDPSSVTLLSATALYADHPNGLFGDGLFVGCVGVEGKLVIDVDYTFDYAGLVMQEGAEIEIRQYRTLKIQNQTVLHGCLSMWKGISLAGYNSGLDMENSTVRDAQYAVKIANSLTQVRLVNNVFDANYVGFYTTPGTAHQITKLSGGNAYISNNQFVFNANYLPPYAGQSPSPGSHPYAAFEMNDAQYFNIGSPNNGNIINTIQDIERGLINRGGNSFQVSINQYSGLQVSHPANLYSNSIGVLIENTPITVNVRFNNINQVAYGIQSNGSSYKNLERNTINANVAGIAIQNETKGDVLVKRNTITVRDQGRGALITNCHIGQNFLYELLDNNITVDQGEGIVVANMSGPLNIMDENEIDFNHVPSPGSANPDNTGIALLQTLGPATVKNNKISVSSNFLAQAGIALQNCNNIHVVENEVLGNFFGTGLSSVFSTNVLWCCNETPATIGGGFRFLGQCAGTNLSNNRFIGVAHQFSTGLYLIQAEIGPQINRGNDWTMTNAWVDASFIGLGDPQNSLIKTDPALVPNGYTKIQVPFPYFPSDWFKFIGIDPTCGSQVNCGTTPYEFVGDPNDSGILTDHDLTALEPVSDTNEPVLQVLKWELQRYLYQKLSHNPSLVNWNNEVAAFYNSAQNGLLGQFVALETRIRGLAHPLGQSGLDADEIVAELFAISQEVAAIDAQFPTATPQEQSALLAQKTALFQQGTALNADLATLEAQISAWRIGEINELLAINNVLVPVNAHQQFEKDMNAVLLETLAQGSAVFTPSQQTLVTDIAGYCPSTHGKGVLVARLLKEYFAPAPLWAYDECLPTEPRSREGAQPAQIIPDSEVLVFPNPAQRGFMVQFENPLGSNASLTLIDLVGKTILAHNLSQGSTNEAIDASGLRPGAYILEIKTEAGRLFFSKIAIVD